MADKVIALILGEEANLRQRARRLVRCSSDADDLVQETLLRAFKTRDRFCEGTSVRAWTLKILWRLYLTNAYKAKRHRTSTGSEEIENALEKSRDRSGEDAEPLNFERYTEDLSDPISQALGRLAPEYWVAFMLYVMEGLSHAEIAELLDVPLGTVLSRVHRAREALRVSLLRHPEYAETARRLGRRA